MVDGVSHFFSDIVKWIGAAIMAAFGWLLKSTHKKIDDNKKAIEDAHDRLQEVEVDVAKNYMTKQEFLDFRVENRMSLAELKGEVRDGFKEMREKGK